MANAETAAEIIETGPEAVGYDEKLFEQARELMKRRGWSATDLARQVSYSPAMLSKYLSRQLNNPEGVETALASLFVKEGRIASGPGFAWTAQAAAIITGAEFALEQRRIVPIYVRAGVGKTTAARYFMDRKARESKGKYAFLWITADGHLTASELLKELLNRLHVPVRGTCRAMLLRVIAELQRRRYVIIVDDATKLRYDALEDLRRMHDEATCGIVLMGTEALMTRLLLAAGRNGEDLEQLHSRMGMRPVIPPKVTRKDQEAVARAKKADLSEKALEIICKPHRTPRVIHNLMDLAEHIRRSYPTARYDELLIEAEKLVFEAA